MSRFWITRSVLAGTFALFSCAAPDASLPTALAAGEACEASQPVATFSIVAFDPERKQWGVAVQSKFLAVGAVVPWAEAGKGAIATQAWANTTYGPQGLAMLAAGKSAREVVEALTAKDPRSARRQLGVVDAQGNAASFTGEACMAWAGGRTGKHYCVQGNILAGEDVVEAMAKGYEEAQGSFAERLIASLRAGQAAGGDKRGRQSAALYIVRERGGYSGFNDRAVDLRVDDHKSPIEELERLYQMHRRIFDRQRPARRESGSKKHGG
jgi:uncharacterized Ntn-hydrolase superfamily protein